MLPRSSIWPSQKFVRLIVVGDLPVSSWVADDPNGVAPCENPTDVPELFVEHLTEFLDVTVVGPPPRTEERPDIVDDDHLRSGPTPIGDVGRAGIVESRRTSNRYGEIYTWQEPNIRARRLH